MALFGGQSLVDSVDEIINLVKNWNVMHCGATNIKSRSSNCKKRAAPASIMTDNIMNATPAKKNKRNILSSNLNCLIDLEKEARIKLCKLVIEGIESEYKIKQAFTDEKEENEYLYSQLSRPKHGRGEITLPCFKLCKLLDIKNAHQIATDLCKFISLSIESSSGVLFLCNPFLKVEAIKGRINAYFAAEYITRIISLILNKNNSFLCALPLKNEEKERVMVEYSQPNTHKAFHVGHMRNVALGDCLIRLYEHCGYPTVAVNYFGDEGAHVAKCIWLLQKEKINLDSIEKDMESKGEWLGEKYAQAVEMLTLSTYTKFAYIGVVVGKVLTKEKHPTNEKLNVVSVEYSMDPDKKIANVVCGGTHYDIGNLVAYIPIGYKYKDKLAEKKDIGGVISEGVIMGANELGVKLPPLQIENIKEEKKESQAKKKKKKNKKKMKKLKDDRIYLVNEFYPDAQIGDKLTEIGKYSQYSSCDDVEQLCLKYQTEQENILKLLESGDSNCVSLWQRTRQWSLDEFKKIYAWLGARFDYDFFESECSQLSRQLVDEYYDKGIFVKSQGAIGIHLDDENLGFCMLLKSNGSGLYATKDLALAKKKFEQYKIAQSIYVVDATQERHFQQVFATLNKMGYKQSEKCYHLKYAFVRLPAGKMATRSRNVILFSQLVQLLADEINQQFLNNYKEETESKWNESELCEAERAISVGAIRYGMLNHDNNKEIIFDLKKWTLSSGNTGPYLMYQYARIASINRKVKSDLSENLNYSILIGGSNHKSDEITKAILFQLSQFQSKIQQILQDKSPSQLCDYLYTICKLFSQWYSIKDNSIIHCNDPQLKAARLHFCDAVAKTIKVGIQLLGITPLERM